MSTGVTPRSSRTVTSSDAAPTATPFPPPTGVAFTIGPNAPLLGVPLGAEAEPALAGLVAAIGEQPRVFVHKDVHSCNLLRTAGISPGRFKAIDSRPVNLPTEKRVVKALIVNDNDDRLETCADKFINQPSTPFLP